MRAWGRRWWRVASGGTAVAVVEIGLYTSYRGHDAQFHWFTHFFVGASAALLVMAAVAARRRRPVRRPLLWPLLGHVVAMLPDVLFVSGEAHERWMDVFLGHLSSHFVPGRNGTWYVVFLGALAAYLVVLDRLREALDASTSSGAPMAATDSSPESRDGP